LKKQAIKPFVLLSLLLSLSALNVYAQGDKPIRKVEIPFDFSVRDKTLPAGVYSISRVNQDKTMLLLRSEDGREAVNISTYSVQAKQRPEKGKLIFHRYGETYFLSQIWEPNEMQRRQLSNSRRERSIERDLSKRGEEPSIVDLAPTP
jgi:hypothetical protein